jgi:hypothetical protein
LRLSLSGLAFSIHPAEDLSEQERQALERLGQFETPLFGRETFALHLCDQPPWKGAEASGVPMGAPAAVQPHEDTVRVRHAALFAELEPLKGRGRLYRNTIESFALEICLRVALGCRLPLEGGLPLHAAGLAAEGKGLAFFGPSGAGKSTLAGVSPYPVLSDELIAITPSLEGFQLRATGFWGTLDGGKAERTALPLAGLFSLEKGDRFNLTRLDRMAAFRRLLEVLLVPSAPWLWSPAMAVLNRLVGEVPVYRMAWSPSQPPWEELEQRLARSKKLPL